jgi:hypothetical protein
MPSTAFDNSSQLVANGAYCCGRGHINVSGALNLSLPLTFQNYGFLQATSISSSIPLTISGSQSGGVNITTDLLTAPSLSLTNNVGLTGFASTTTQMHELQVNVGGTISVDRTSQINVNGNGYQPGHTTGNTKFGAANCGGSFGGWGNGSTNAVYGDYTNPNDWGSGGISSGILGATAGGGLVRINAGILQLDGKLLADANNGDFGSGGSGGGIYVSVATLSGGGTIRAAGGNGHGAGGGGRVAVYALDSSGFGGVISAPGAGNVSGGLGGGAGTVYLRDPRQPYGTLTLDNLNGPGLTPLGLNQAYSPRPPGNFV